VELGSFPGGWSQVFASKLKRLERHVAVDLQQMSSMDQVSFIKGDFREECVKHQIKKVLQSGVADIVAWYDVNLYHSSDAAPNKTNNREGDMIRASELAAEAWQLARCTLSKHGHFLCKMFQSNQAGIATEMFTSSIDALEGTIVPHFKRVVRLRPASVRKASSEYYLLCISLRGSGVPHSSSESST
jgi:23S rRNA (uridine2552-2'-O)-methyltransferase